MQCADKHTHSYKYSDQLTQHLEQRQHNVVR